LTKKHGSNWHINSNPRSIVLDEMVYDFF